MDKPLSLNSFRGTPIQRVAEFLGGLQAQRER